MNVFNPTPIATATTVGTVKPDNSTTTVDPDGTLHASGGGGPSGANPTAVAGPVAINGSAATFLRSDGAPAVQKASAAQFGIVEVDGTTIIATGGVISVAPNQRLAAIVFVIDGLGAAISAGIKPYLEIPFACTIQEVTLLADQTGSITVDIWKCTYAQFDAGTTHPVAGDSITAAAVPAIASAKKYDDAVLTGWNTTINAGDVLGFNVSGVSTITKCTLTLKVLKT